MTKWLRLEIEGLFRSQDVSLGLRMNLSHVCRTTDAETETKTETEIVASKQARGICSQSASTAAGIEDPRQQRPTRKENWTRWTCVALHRPRGTDFLSLDTYMLF